MANRSKKLGFETVLGEKELIAIGQITAQWSFLEHWINIIIADMLKKSSRDIEFDFHSSFLARSRICKELAKEMHEKDTSEKIINIIERALTEKYNRDRINHDTWAGDPSIDLNLVPTQFWKDDSELKEKHLTADEIMKTAIKISWINRDLLKLIMCDLMPPWNSLKRKSELPQSADHIHHPQSIGRVSKKPPPESSQK